MQVPLQVTFRGIAPSDAVEADIRARAEKLEQFYDRITSNRVTVEAPHRHHHKGNLYRVCVDLTVPGGEIVVGRDPEEHHAHEDVYVAIRDAFDAARRQLEDHVRRGRGQVKSHEVPGHGRVSKLFPRGGIIETADEREIYFHRNSVADDAFDRFEVGLEVRFVAAEGESEKGPQATTVHIVGKHHIVD
jgi:ribosome-associated translation inhibitor RaiA/cold shock CspA family protein